jgi:hypothetical protein
MIGMRWWENLWIPTDMLIDKKLNVEPRNTVARHPFRGLSLFDK